MPNKVHLLEAPQAWTREGGRHCSWLLIITVDPAERGGCRCPDRISPPAAQQPSASGSFPLVFILLGETGGEPGFGFGSLPLIAFRIKWFQKLGRSALEGDPAETTGLDTELCVEEGGARRRPKGTPASALLRVSQDSLALRQPHRPTGPVSS